MLNLPQSVKIVFAPKVSFSPPIADGMLTAFLRIRGQFCSAQWVRDCKTRKGILARVQKVVNASNIRAGVDYDNRQTVQNKRESGELPAVNAGLPWGEWAKDGKGNSLFPHVITHKGETYLRFDVLPSSRFETTFLVDGNPTKWNDVAPMLGASERRLTEHKDCLTLKASNLLSLTSQA